MTTSLCLFAHVSLVRCINTEDNNRAANGISLMILCTYLPMMISFIYLMLDNVTVCAYLLVKSAYALICGVLLLMLTQFICIRNEVCHK